MKAICIKQPWAQLIADGIKTIEIRSWKTDHRGKLLIITSLTPIPTSACEKKECRRMESLHIFNQQCC